MIEEQAQVIKLDSNNAQFAWVETQRQSSCGHCNGKSSCGTQVLSKVLAQRSNSVKVLNTCHAQKGDRVIIGIDEQSLLSGSFYLYFIPLLAMIIFSLLATIFSHRLDLSSIIIDVNAIIFAVIGFITGVWLTRKKITSDTRQFQAKIIKVLDSNHAFIDFSVSSLSSKSL